MSRQDKLNEGQVLLNDSNNYLPLDKPMVETTTKKAQQLIKTLLSEGHIDKTTAKWLSLTSDTPRIPVFYILGQERNKGVRFNKDSILNVRTPSSRVRN